MPNTFLSHKLIQAVPPDQQDSIVEAIFHAFFVDGKDIGKKEILLDLAEDIGLDRSEMKNALASTALQEKVKRDLIRAEKLQIRGVPFFIINHALALSGAHPPENFLRAFSEAKTGFDVQ